MKILLSAYACEPEAGSEPGGGYSVLRAAAECGECWVMTRTNNVAAIATALEKDPPTHPVHVVPVDLSPTFLRLKRAAGATRTYYALWQKKARRVGQYLDEQLHFDVVHHVTFSAFWLPIGILGLRRPAVVGPISGATFTPRPLLRFLGWRGFVLDSARYVTIQFAVRWARSRFRNHVKALIAQDERVLSFAQRALIGPQTFAVAHPNASQPDVAVARNPSVREPEILCIGRLLPLKGGALALHAFAQAELSPEVSLCFIGEGPDLSRLMRLSQKLSLDRRVRFQGSLSRHEVLERISSALALLFPSFHDSAGFAVAEALSLGLPVVCLDHGGPGALTRLWPQCPSVAVPVRSAGQVVRDLAAALERYALRPAPIPEGRHHAVVSLGEILNRAYAAATAQGPR
ncbi:MAG: glycosyltransferase family 4 protein [Acidimicrobiia bacterium]